MPHAGSGRKETLSFKTTVVKKSEPDAACKTPDAGDKETYTNSAVMASIPRFRPACGKAHSRLAEENKQKSQTTKDRSLCQTSNSVPIQHGGTESTTDNARLYYTKITVTDTTVDRLQSDVLAKTTKSSKESTSSQVGETMSKDSKSILVDAKLKEVASRTDAVWLQCSDNSCLSKASEETRVEKSGRTNLPESSDMSLGHTTIPQPTLGSGSGHMEGSTSTQGGNLLPPVGFWAKFVEVQQRMWYFVRDRPGEYDQYSSGPMEWLFCSKSVLQWKSRETSATIQFQGNKVVWLSSAGSLFLYTVLLIFYLIARKRQCPSMEEDLWRQFVTMGHICVGGYLLHFLPYFLSERALFTHQYFPALFFSMLLCPLMLDHLLTHANHFLSRLVFHSAVVLWLSVMVSEHVDLLCQILPTE